MFPIVECSSKTTTPTENEQKNERKNGDASAKSKELHSNAQSRLDEAGLILPNRTNDKQL